MPDAYQISLLVFIGIYSLWGWSQWLPIRSGVLLLGQAGLIAIGAYVSAVLTRNGVPFPVALIAGSLAGAVGGTLMGLSALRLPPFGTALITLSESQLIQTFLSNFEPAGASQGIFGLPNATNVWLVWGIVLLVTAALARLSSSTFALAMHAMREDEVLAGAMGVNGRQHKLLIFALSGLVAGCGGVLYAHYIRNVAPELFGFAVLLQISTFLFVGGRTVYWGPVVGAAVLVGITEGLRFLSEYRLLVYGLFLVLVMLFRPDGLVTASTARVISQAFRGWVGREGRRTERDSKSAGVE